MDIHTKIAIIQSQLDQVLAAVKKKQLFADGDGQTALDLMRWVCDGRSLDGGPDVLGRKRAVQRLAQVVDENGKDATIDLICISMTLALSLMSMRDAEASEAKIDYYTRPGSDPALHPESESVFMSVTLSPALTNHAIWTKPPTAIARVSEVALRGGMGNPTMAAWPILWCVRDTESGAHLKVWLAGQAADEWLVAWIDGAKRPGSGRAMAEAMCGEGAGGVLDDYSPDV